MAYNLPSSIFEQKYKHFYGAIFVKLYSEIALPTELQLDRVGVDFVFPLSQLTN